MGCSGQLSIRCYLGGEARIAEGCSIVEDSVSRALHWVERHRRRRSLSSISVLLQNKGYIEVCRPQRLTSSLWKAPEHFRALHKALALCVDISLERKFKASVTLPNEVGNKSESFLSTDVRERAVANEKLSSELH